MTLLWGYNYNIFHFVFYVSCLMLLELHDSHATKNCHASQTEAFSHLMTLPFTLIVIPFQKHVLSVSRHDKLLNLLRMECRLQLFQVRKLHEKVLQPAFHSRAWQGMAHSRKESPWACPGCGRGIPIPDILYIPHISMTYTATCTSFGWNSLACLPAVERGNYGS